MEKKALISLLQQPSRITAAQTAALEELHREYPFFQAARAVRLKGLKNESSLHYNRELKITAAHTTDRSVLFDFITSEEFHQDAISEQIKQQVQPTDAPLEAVPDSEAAEEKEQSLDDALRMKVRESEQIFDPELFSRFVPKTPTKEEQKSAEAEESRKKLQMGRPLDFGKEESHSFSEWLQLTKAAPLPKEKETPEPPAEISRKFELIDEFILKSPKINPVKSARKTNLAERNLTAPEALMTETLARVYLEQKNYTKAIQAYKILILKNPEKSGFFADQIRAIEKLQENNS